VRTGRKRSQKQPEEMVLPPTPNTENSLRERLSWVAGPRRPLKESTTTRGNARGDKEKSKRGGGGTKWGVYPPARKNNKCEPLGYTGPDERRGR